MSKLDGYRSILHVDMDAFFASVEQADRPELQGKPVIVGGSPRSRGVVATCSYEARSFGVVSAMPCAEAYRLCPQGIFVSPNFKRYVEVAHQIRDVFYEVTDKVEPVSIDEAYLDITENYLGEMSSRHVAEFIKRRIFEETSCTASVGVAPNKFIAKIASDLNKPNGVSQVVLSQALDFLKDLPLKKIPGVGPATELRLQSLGVKTIGDLRERSPQSLLRAVGKFGAILYQRAFGIDQRKVASSSESKSMANETTFKHDIEDFNFLFQTICQQIENLVSQLIKKDSSIRTLTLKIRYKGFETITRSQSLSFYTRDSEFLKSLSREILESEERLGTDPVRLIGVSLSNFQRAGDPEQLLLEF